MIEPKKLCALSTFLVILLSSVEAAGSRGNGMAKEWDYILFTQHWPATVCLQWKAEGRGHSCALPKESMWTVHGVWPTKTNTKGPTFCNTSMPFDEEALTPIVNELDEFWINIDVPTSPYSFWRHEWEKHGTCAAQLACMNKEVSYFKQGLSWQKSFSLYSALEKAGFSEGKLYSPNQVRKAVKEHFGKMPEVHCFKDEHSGKSYLFEVRLCFDKQMEIIDCPKAMSTNCPTAPVVYPSMQEVSKKYEVKGKWLLDVLRIVRWIQWITY